MKKLLLVNPEQVEKEMAMIWPVREAARGVVFDADGLVALLHVRKHGYYKLPGGGIDEGEEAEAAFKRECLEEIGCDVEIVAEIGIIEEWRKIFNLRQISYCYRACVLGEKGEPEFTESERHNDFALVWVSLAEARRLMAEPVPENREGREYIMVRDAAILAALG